MSDTRPPGDLVGNDPSTELSSNRTSLSFERTRMSADRTLMSTVRTALSLISFGFTIYQVLGKASALVPNASVTGRNLGMGMLILGITMLVMGLVSHAVFDRELGRRRERLHGMALLRREVRYHMTPTYVSALAVLALGVMAFVSIALRILGKQP
jgi:putative membrane protein